MEVAAATRALPARTSLRRLALLGGIALGLVAVRAALREVHVPGHVALPTLFSLVLARFVAPGIPAASAVAATSGLVGAGLGMGMGIGGALTPLLAAGVVDAAGRFLPRILDHAISLAGLGAVAGLTRVLPALAVGFFPALAAEPGAGAGPAAVFVAAALAALPHAAFGALGAVLAPAAARSRAGRASQGRSAG